MRSRHRRSRVLAGAIPSRRSSSRCCVLAVYADPLLTRRGSSSGATSCRTACRWRRRCTTRWSRGRLPVWNDDVSGGRPLLPNPNAGALYPAAAAALARCRFRWRCASFPVAALGDRRPRGMLSCSRALGASGAAAWIAAATYAFSGVLVSEVFYLPLQAGAALHAVGALGARPPGGARAGRKAAVLGRRLRPDDARGRRLRGRDRAARVGALDPARTSRPGAPRARRRGARAAGSRSPRCSPRRRSCATALLVPRDAARGGGAARSKEVLGSRSRPGGCSSSSCRIPFGEVWTLDDHFVWSARRLSSSSSPRSTAARSPFVASSACRGARPRGAVLRACSSASARCSRSPGSLVPAAWGLRRSPVPLRYPGEVRRRRRCSALALAAGPRPSTRSARRGAPRWLGARRRGGPDGRRGRRRAVAGGARAGSPSPRWATSPAVARARPREQLPGALAEAGLLWTATLVALALLARSRRARGRRRARILTAVPIVANRRIAPTEHEAGVFPPTASRAPIARRDPARRLPHARRGRVPSASALRSRATARARTGHGADAASLVLPHAVALGPGHVFNVDLDRGDFSRLESLRRSPLFAAASPTARPSSRRCRCGSASASATRSRCRASSRFGGDDLQDWDENPDALPGHPSASSAGARRRTRSRRSGSCRGWPPARSSSRRAAARSGAARPGDRARPRAQPGAAALSRRAPDPTWLFVLRGFWSYRTVRVDGAAVEARSGAARVHRGARSRRATTAIEWREDVPGFEVSRWGPALFAALLLAASACGAAAGRRVSAAPPAVPAAARPGARGCSSRRSSSLLYADPLVLRRNFSGRDLIAYNLPMEKSIHDAWARGRLPVWTPEISGGRPLAPNPNAGALYPVRVAAVAASVSAGRAHLPGPALDRGRASGCSPCCSRSGARARPPGSARSTYVFSGVVVSEAFFPHIQPGMALLPWILWAACARPARRRGVGCCRCPRSSRSTSSAADVFTIAIAIGCAALWIALEERPTRRALRGSGRSRRPSRLGALAAAPQIVATALWIPQTNRAVLGMKLSDAVYFSIHPWRLLELVVPYPFGARLGDDAPDALGLAALPRPGDGDLRRRSTAGRLP